MWWLLIVKRLVAALSALLIMFVLKHDRNEGRNRESKARVCEELVDSKEDGRYCWTHIEQCTVDKQLPNRHWISLSRTIRRFLYQIWPDIISSLLLAAYMNDENEIKHKELIEYRIKVKESGVIEDGPYISFNTVKTSELFQVGWKAIFLSYHDHCIEAIVLVRDIYSIWCTALSHNV